MSTGDLERLAKVPRERCNFTSQVSGSTNLRKHPAKSSARMLMSHALDSCEK